MMRKITPAYIDEYNKVILTQPLSHGKWIKQIYDKSKRGWEVTYESNSSYHICPYDGVFRKCNDCGALDENFDISFCVNKTQVVSLGALNGRIHDCMRAGLEVQFLD